MKAQLEGKSDFGAKNPYGLPEMLFNEENCDLFDQVRPINWVDPDAEVSLHLLEGPIRHHCDRWRCWRACNGCWLSFSWRKGGFD